MWAFKPVRAPGFCRQAHIPAPLVSGLRDAPVPRASSLLRRWELPRRVGSRSLEPWCNRCRFSSARTCPGRLEHRPRCAVAALRCGCDIRRRQNRRETRCCSWGFAPSPRPAPEGAGCGLLLAWLLKG